MTKVSIKYQDERLELDIPDERIVATWEGPVGVDREGEIAAIRDALEQPVDFPPLRQLVVPGDRVTVALDSMIVHPQPILALIGQILGQAGVELNDVTVLATSADNKQLDLTLWPGAVLKGHDPRDRSELAYLAATKQGRRIYLNRLLTDAEVVIPVGRLGFDPIMGFRGPWSVVFPELSEQAAIDTHRGRYRDLAGELTSARASTILDESFEVSWLLGSQFHVGVVPGDSGSVAVVAGREQAVRERGIDQLNSNWSFDAGARAEMVLAGIGGPDRPTTIDDLIAGLVTASRLVQRGGKIVALSRARGTIGPALGRLTDIDDPKQRAAALRGHEDDDDFVAARRLAQVLDWADVFVMSSLPPDLVEGLSLVPIERADQAGRLVARSGSCSFVNRAELTRAFVREEDGTR